MDPNTRLRLATRIHFALLRHFDANVDVRSLLQGSAEGREALWVCYAADDPELRALAAQFASASDAAPAAAPRPGTEADGPDAADAAPSRWPNPLAWLRRGTPPRDER